MIKSNNGAVCFVLLFPVVRRRKNCLNLNFFSHCFFHRCWACAVTVPLEALLLRWGPQQGASGKPTPVGDPEGLHSPDQQAGTELAQEARRPLSALGPL